MEEQKWWCKYCNKNYSLNRKDKHLLTKVHEKNKTRCKMNEILEEIDILFPDGEGEDLFFEEFVIKFQLVD